MGRNERDAYKIGNLIHKFKKNRSTKFPRSMQNETNSLITPLESLRSLFGRHDVTPPRGAHSGKGRLEGKRGGQRCSGDIPCTWGEGMGFWERVGGGSLGVMRPETVAFG